MFVKHPVKPSTITCIAYAALACWALICVVAGVLLDNQAAVSQYHDLTQNAETHTQQQLNRLGAELNKLRIYPLILANQSDVKYVLQQYIQESDATDLASHPQTLNSPAKERLDLLLQSLAPKLHVSSIFVLTPGGYIISSSRGPIDPEDATSFDYRHYFGEAIAGMSGEQFAISPTTGAPGFFFSYPVTADETNTIDGIVVVRVDGSSFAGNFVYGSTITFMTDRNGVVMLSTRPDFFLKTANKRTTQHVPAQQREENYSQRVFQPLPIADRYTPDTDYPLVDVGSGVGRLPYIQVSKAIPNTEWQVHMLFPVTGVLQARQYKALLVFFVFIAVSLVLIVIERLLHYAQTVREQSRRDPLTQLYNRYFMQESLDAMCAAHDRGHLQSLTALMLDLDHFKSINDNYGHLAGDNALRRVAKTLARQARRSDMIYRVGGEEFLIIMVGQSPQEAITAAERLRKCIEMVHKQKPAFSYKLTISGGLAQRRKQEALQDFLQRADDLLYAAKDRGRNQVCTDFDESLQH